MKFTLSWLKEHLDTIATADGIADRLTMIGLEVESVEDPSKAFAPFRIARVISAEKHPNADRLRVCVVDPGDGDDGAGGLRRAECADRHDRRLRPGRHVHPRHRREAREGRDPRRRVERHAPLRARARPLRRP